MSKLLNLSEFCDSFGGMSGYRENDGYCWTNFNQNKFLVTRYPLSCLLQPSKEEIDAVFKKLRPIFISFALPADEVNKENTFLYISHDHEYVIDKLKAPQRRTTKKALLSFEFKHINWDEFEEKGYKCFNDSRERNNLSDGTLNNFKKMIKASRKIPSYKILAAVDPGSDKLAAVLILNHVKNLVTTIGHYSDNDFLDRRPNNGLFHQLKQIYLVSKLVDTIEYGYSSIQKSSNHESLHFFKVSIGFDAVPISRQFIVNPKYKLLFNPLFKRVYKLLLKIQPKNKYLLKVSHLF